MTITQAVTIVAAPGIQASISSSTGAAITVSAGPSDVVLLRNLYLNAQGAEYGIVYQSAAALQVENLVINGFTNKGILMDLTTASQLYIADTIVRNSATGILLSSASGFANISIVRALLENNSYGIVAFANARASVKDTVASGNTYATSTSTLVELYLEGCVASGNGTGISASSGGGSAKVWVSNCSVTGNYREYSWVPMASSFPGATTRSRATHSAERSAAPSRRNSRGSARAPLLCIHSGRERPPSARRCKTDLVRRLSEPLVSDRLKSHWRRYPIGFGIRADLDCRCLPRR